MRDVISWLKQKRIGDSLVRRNPLVYRRVRSDFEGLQDASLEARQQWLESRLAATLDLARRTAYGKRVRGGADITTWPFLSKAQVLERPGDHCPRRVSFVAHATTGGTTGSPLPVVRTLSSVAAEQAAIDYAIGKMNLEASRAKVAVLRADNVKEPSDRRPPFWIFASGGSRLVLSAQHLAVDTLPHYIEAIERFAPDVLWVYPSALESLCMLLEKTGRRVRVPRVLSSSEVLSDSSWRLAQDVLACRLVDYYGQAERVAFSLAEQPGRHRFLAGYSFVELVPVWHEASHSYYEIVGTSLWNDAMPLVRYRTADTIRLPASFDNRELSEVALGLRDFPGVIGRSGEFLLSPEGTRIIGLNHFPKGTNHVLRLQVVQEAVDEVLIRVLATHRYDHADHDTLLKNVRAKVPSSMRVDIQRVDALEATKSGKVPFVIRRPQVKEQFDRSSAASSTKSQ